ncbi:MAG: hypothetical protein EOP08_05425, partial [Proteobacteria bacterium]
MRGNGHQVRICPGTPRGAGLTLRYLRIRTQFNALSGDSGDPSVMGPLKRARSAWHKNSYEILGLVNGGLPGFVHLPWSASPGFGVPVFHYHVVTPQALEADLCHLRTNGYTTLDGDAFLAHLRGDRPAERAVLLTFDDGPRNFFTVALPLLERFRARAMAFIAPGLHLDDASAEVLASPRRPMTWAELGRVHSSGLVDIECHTLESRYVPRWPE